MGGDAAPLSSRKENRMYVTEPEERGKRLRKEKSGMKKQRGYNPREADGKTPSQ